MKSSSFSTHPAICPSGLFPCSFRGETLLQSASPLDCLCRERLASSKSALSPLELPPHHPRKRASSLHSASERARALGQPLNHHFQRDQYPIALLDFLATLRWSLPSHFGFSLAFSGMRFLFFSERHFVGAVAVSSFICSLGSCCFASTVSTLCFTFFVFLLSVLGKTHCRGVLLRPYPPAPHFIPPPHHLWVSPFSFSLLFSPPPQGLPFSSFFAFSLPRTLLHHPPWPRLPSQLLSFRPLLPE